MYLHRLGKRINSAGVGFRRRNQTTDSDLRSLAPAKAVAYDVTEEATRHEAFYSQESYKFEISNRRFCRL